MHNRRKARVAVLQSLYAVELGGNNPVEAVKNIVKKVCDNDIEAIKYSEKLLYNTVDNASEHDRMIQKHITNWEINRLATIDKLILRMAISELLFSDEVPTKVTINEAIELAKDFSTRKSGTFVNGILDAILTDLTSEGKIKKTGRGLIESSQNQ